MNTDDLKQTIRELYVEGKLTIYQRFDLLLKIDQNEKLDEILKFLKK